METTCTVTSTRTYPLSELMYLLERAVTNPTQENLQDFRDGVATLEKQEYQELERAWLAYGKQHIEGFQKLPDYAELFREEERREKEFRSSCLGAGLPPVPAQEDIHARVLEKYLERATFPKEIFILVGNLEWNSPWAEEDSEDLPSSRDEDPEELSEGAELAGLSYKETCSRILSYEGTNWWLAVLKYQHSRFNYDRAWTRQEASEHLREELPEFIPAQI